jgi:hypothetical protein
VTMTGSGQVMIPTGAVEHIGNAFAALGLRPDLGKLCMIGKVLAMDTSEPCRDLQ